MNNIREYSNNKKFILLIVFILLIIVSITGTTYAYLAFSASNNSVVVGEIGTADLDLNVTKVTTNNGELVPQLESALGTAVSSTYNCVDGNGNAVCQVYKIDIKNIGTSNIKVRGTIVFDNPSALNLKYKLMDDSTTLSSSGSRYGYEDIESPLVNSTSFVPNQTNTYYMVIWVDETGDEQADSGTYRATVKFDNSELDGASSTYVNYMTNNTSDTFRSDTYREKIKTASFVDYIDVNNASLDENSESIYWDMSENEDNSIIAWLEDNEADGYYDLYIGSQLKIYVKKMDRFFYSMSKLENINFFNLDTSLTTSMVHMFYYCLNLTSLDLTSFKLLM